MKRLKPAERQIGRAGTWHGVLLSWFLRDGQDLGKYECPDHNSIR
jgi:hypothetical protein